MTASTPDPDPVIDAPRGHGPADDARSRLLLERASAVELIKSLADEFDGIVASTDLVATDDEHDPEGHTIAFERQQIAALLRGARARLLGLDHAIALHQSGTYGTCRRCGRRIADERLAVLPAAQTCITCAV